MSLEDRLLIVGEKIARIARTLPTLGYVFEDPDAAFPGPEPDTDAAIEQIEREIGPLPLAIKLFWRHIGSVNFIGRHEEWEGCEYPDPLVVYPPSLSILELEEFLGDREERLRCDFPYSVLISPDHYHKENVSGGAPYSLDMPATADDPPLQDESHHTTFITYLEIAARCGGFPGLERCETHNWPIHKITAPLTA